MNLLLITIALFLVPFKNGSNQQAAVSATKTEYISESLFISDPLYDIQLKIENVTNKPNLAIYIQLKSGSHFISPNAKRDFTGKFNIELENYNVLDFKGKIMEDPLSIEEFDPHPFVGGLVNWVRVNTTYKQPLNILVKDNFKEFGKVQFVIEPRCTLEEISFVISYNNGVMNVKRMQN